MSTGLLLDGVFASEAIDSSGEILDIDGLDTIDFDEGKGVANYEHKGHEGQSNGEEIVGKIVYSHKIFERSDCANDRERMFWDKVKLPFLYGVVRLLDGAGHDGAKALAANIRDSHANDEPIIVQFSIEGSTLEKDKNTNRLKSTIAKRVALTMRPCNKTAVSGLLSDPNAPEGYERHPVKPDLLAMVPMGNQTRTNKSDHSDPRYQRLGGSEAIYGPDITKAMSAGSYGAAPGTLTGGAALQVEDRTLKAMAHAAYRDWDRVQPFKKFLKFQMPEASDEFIEHFSDIVDRHLFRVRKAVEVVTDLKKAGKLAGPKDAGIAVKPPEKKLPRLTVQGRPVPPPPVGVPTPSFDHHTGTLTTDRGVFSVSTPSKPHPHLVRHMRTEGRDPSSSASSFASEVTKSRPHHLRAMQNWFKMNDKFSRGDIHPSVVSHAVAFTLMSANTPVPIQEVGFGHMVDAMRNQNLSSIETKHDWDKVQPDWLSRSGQGLPKHSRQHFVNLEAAYHGQKGGLRAEHGAGKYQGFSLPGKVSQYFGGYLEKDHKQVMEAIRDAKGDANVVVRRLSQVKGIKTKVARYLVGMLGGGNNVIPDTHFIRNHFGLRPDAPGQQPGMSPDAATGEHLKNVLLKSTSSHDIMEGIDNHYFNNHDAVKHVLNDPQIGPYFKGREKQAIFPAFWSHWISIPGHENANGTPNARGSIAATDHAPFWDAVADVLHKSETQYDPDLPMATAKQHHRWIEQYGDMAAMNLYFRHLAPKLIANDELQGQSQSMVAKMEAHSVELLKAADAATPPPLPNNNPIKWNGRQITPGHGKMTLRGGAQDGKAMRVLHVGTNDTHAIEADKFNGPWDHSDVVKLPRHAIQITAHPQTIDSPDVVVGKEHNVGEYNSHPETAALAHGFSFGSPRQTNNTQSGSKGRSFWANTPAGQTVFVKPNKVLPGVQKHNRARYEGAYSNIARDFFGMGQYVPKAAVVRHPRSGTEHAIIEHVEGDEYDRKNYDHQKILREHNESGELDKMAMMNMVMGNGDRHVHNYLIDSKKRQLKLIDHDGIMDSTQSNYYPAYWSHHHVPPQLNDRPDVQKLGWHENAPPYDNRDDYGANGRVSAMLSLNQLHPKAVSWVDSLDPKELESHLQKHEIPAAQTEAAVQRLTHLKAHLKSRPNTDKDSAFVLPQVLTRNKM